MTTLTRRAVLAGAAAATALARSPTSAPPRAAAPLAGKQTPGWYRYKVGTHEVTVVTDGVNRFKFPDSFVANKNRDEVNDGLAAAFLQPATDKIAIPYSPIVVNTGSQARRHRHRHGRGQLRAQQGRCRPVPQQPQGRRHRPQPGRHRHHLALPRRPHQRPARRRQQARVPQRRDPGAGGGMEVLHGRRRDGQADQRPHEGRVRERCAACSTRSAARSRPTSRTRRWRRASPRSRPTATRPATSRTSSPRATARCIVQADVTNHPVCSCAIPAGTCMFDQDANMAEATRRKVYDMLAAEKMMVQGFHYPFPALGLHREERNRLSRDPVPWNPTI